jgi:hypothetical protein
MWYVALGRVGNVATRSKPVRYAGKEESFEHEALRRAERMANKKSGAKPTGGKKSLAAKVKALIGAR